MQDEISKIEKCGELNGKKCKIRWCYICDEDVIYL